MIRLLFCSLLPMAVASEAALRPPIFDDAVDTSTSVLLRGRRNLLSRAVEVTNTSLLYAQPDDLGIRFNKFPLVNDSTAAAAVEGILPLGRDDYPMMNDVALTLQANTLAHSIMAAGDYECRNDDVSSWITSLGGPPPYPSTDPANPYWEKLKTVAHVQLLRQIDSSIPASQVMPLPQLWQNYTLLDVANAVHLPILGTHHLALLAQFCKAGLQIDPDILPVRGQRDFIGREVRLQDLANWAIGEVAAVDFWIKWTIGRPRPEEIAWMITTGNLTEADGVPSDLIHTIQSMGLEYPENFTAFPEGCPPHPSWPAMHAASSGMSLWLPVIANVSQEQYCQVLLLDYAVSFARTVAGVHYPDDNIAGLNFAQKYIAHKLPVHLAEKYGSNATKVQEKLETLRFDWNAFDPSKCESSMPMS